MGWRLCTALLPLVPLAGCAPPRCAPPAGRPMLRAELFFGVPDEAGFARFLDTDVTPRFPDGLTVLDAAGRWRAPDGRLTRERSRVVVIVAPPDRNTAARLDAVRQAYEKQFSQQSVGLVTQGVCADF